MKSIIPRFFETFLVGFGGTVGGFLGALINESIFVIAIASGIGGIVALFFVKQLCISSSGGSLPVWLPERRMP